MSDMILGLCLAFAIFLGIGGWCCALYQHQLVQGQQVSLLELADRVPGFCRQIDRLYARIDRMYQEIDRLRASIPTAQLSDLEPTVADLEIVEVGR